MRKLVLIIFKSTLALSIYFLWEVVAFSPSYGQSWRSSLYPENWSPTGNFYTDKIIQDFSYAGYHRGEKAIPFISSNIKDVTAAPYFADKTGATDVTVKIQQAINDVSAAGGGVVYLPAGTYKVSPGSNSFCLSITKSKVILRGAGKGLTMILNSSYSMRSKNIINVGSNVSWYGAETNKTLITKNLTGPTQSIPVANASAFKPGDLVILRNYIGDDWIREHKITQWIGHGSTLKGNTFCREILKVDYTNNIITIDAPIRYSLLTRDKSAVYKVSGMISEVGIEALSIGNIQHPATSGFGEEDYTKSGTPAYHAHASYVIRFNGIVNGWIKDVSTFKSASNKSTAHILSNGILLNHSKNVTVVNCYFQRPQYGGGGGNGYMYRVNGSENLIQSSTAEFSRHGFVFSHMSSSGNVIHKSSDIKTASATGHSGYYKTSGHGSDHHMQFSASNLIDQCSTKDSYFACGFRNFGGTPIHGLTGAHSVYWNLTGNGTTYSKVVHSQQSRYGYVIGTAGNAADVATGEFSMTGSASITAPVDHVEGKGQGAGLQPQSLYLDQVSKRIVTSNPCIANTLPNVTLGSSVSSAVAPAAFTLTANASDLNGSITKVEFYEGTVLLGSDISAPYSLSLTGVPIGTHSYVARATDNCLATKYSLPVPVTVTSSVMNHPPSVTLTSPASSLSLTAPASLNLAASASDADGSIAKVEFFKGDSLLSIDATSPYSHSWTGISVGTYSITAKAYDNLGATKSSSSVMVTVANAATSVGIYGPSCLEKGASATYTIIPASKATTSKWWANTDAILTPDISNDRQVTIKLNSTSSSFTLTCGVHYPVFPYHREYTKLIKVGGCTAQRLAATVSVNPFDQSRKVRVGGATIQEIRVYTINGQLLHTYKNYNGGDEMEIPGNALDIIQILQVVTEDEIVSVLLK